MQGTPYNRIYFQLQVSTLPTKDIESGLLPTPRVKGQEGYETRALRKGHDIAMSYLESNVEYQVKMGMLPTPSVADTEGAPKRPETISRNASGGWTRTADGTGVKYGAKLNDVARLLPTPRANDTQSPAPGTKSFDHRLKRNYMAETVLDLAEAEHGTTSQLSPRFVAEMMGFPPNWTELPFLNGETNLSKDMETQ
jgi:hypothetical protein